MKKIRPIRPIRPIRLIRLICLISMSLFPGLVLAQSSPVPDPVAVQPFLDVPLRHPSICRMPDGTYLLTGAVPSEATAKSDRPDFANNDGVWLWRSSDLRSWESLGQVWSIERDAAPDSWQRQRRADRDDGESARGMTSVRVQTIKGSPAITYSMNGWGGGLLQSRSGKPEGPYDDLGQIVPQAESLSLFEDEGGAVFAVFDEGWIARMKEDLSGVSEPPRLMMPRSGSDLGHSPFTVGRKGAFLTKRDGVYALVVAEWTSRTGHSVYDNFVATARDIYGPYDCRHLMVGHGGETTLFHDGKDNWFATMSGADERAKFRDRPALVPLVWTTEDLYFGRGVKDAFPFKPQHIITERGPWDQCRPLTRHKIRDVEVMVHNDGYVYYTGSSIDHEHHNQVILWRFKLDDTARVGRGGMSAECRTVMPFEDIHWLDFENRMKLGKNKFGKYGLVTSCMDADVFYLRGTFYMTFNLYNTSPGLQQNPTMDGGKTFTAGSGVIRSTSGTWEGPWESVGRAPYPHCELYEAADGTIYTQRGWKGVMALREDGSFAPYAAKENLPAIQYPPDGATFCDDGSAFAGTPFDRTLKNFRWSSTEWNGASSLHIEQRPGSTYNITFSWSESGKEEGPYPRPMNTLPHCGGAAMFRDGKGRFWSTFFGNDNTAPWFTYMGIIPLQLRTEGAQHLIDIADEWPRD